jgi:hypothetical protein
MSYDSNSPPYFCYLSINNLPEFILQIVLMCLSLLLVGDAFRKFYRMLGSHNKHVTFVYRLLFFWWISNLQTTKPMLFRILTVWFFINLTKATARNIAISSSVRWASTISLWIGSMLSRYSGYYCTCLINGNFVLSKGQADFSSFRFSDELKGDWDWDGAFSYFVFGLLDQNL